MKRVITSTVQSMDTKDFQSYFENKYGFELDFARRTVEGLNEKYSGEIICIPTGIGQAMPSSYSNYDCLRNMLGESKDYELTEDDVLEVMKTIKQDFQNDHPMSSTSVRFRGNLRQIHIRISSSYELTDINDITKACVKGTNKIVKSTETKCNKVMDTLDELLDYSEGNVKLTSEGYNEISENLDSLINYIDVNLIDRINKYKSNLKNRVE